MCKETFMRLYYSVMFAADFKAQQVISMQYIADCYS